MFKYATDLLGKTDKNSSFLRHGGMITVLWLVIGVFSGFELAILGEVVDGYLPLGIGAILLIVIAVVLFFAGTVLACLIQQNRPSSKDRLLSKTAAFPVGLGLGYIADLFLAPATQPPTAFSVVMMIVVGLLFFACSWFVLDHEEGELLKSMTIPCSGLLFMFSTIAALAVGNGSPIGDFIFWICAGFVVFTAIYAVLRYWEHRRNKRNGLNYVAFAIPTYISASTTVIVLGFINIGLGISMFLLSGLSLLFCSRPFSLYSYAVSCHSDEAANQEACQENLSSRDTGFRKHGTCEAELENIKSELSRKAALARKELDNVFAGSEISKQPFLTAIEDIEENVGLSLEAASKYAGYDAEKSRRTKEDLIANAKDGIASIDELLSAFAAHEVSELRDGQKKASIELEEAIGRLPAYGIEVS